MKGESQYKKQQQQLPIISQYKCRHYVHIEKALLLEVIYNNVCLNHFKAALDEYSSAYCRPLLNEGFPQR